MHPIPTITAISPTIADANGTAFTLTVVGSNFVAPSVVYWNGSPLTTVVISSGSLTATIQPSNMPIGGQYSVQVYTPPSEPFEYDGGLSNAIIFSANMTAAEAQEYMCDLVDAKRTALTNGFFTFNSTQWNCDYDSTRNLMGVNILILLNSGNCPPGLTWRDMYNNSVPASTPLLAGLASEFLKFGVYAYEASWAHKSNIRTLTSTASVLAYDYADSLWPDPTVQL